MAEIIHAGHRARMRERFRSYGKESFASHELLEMLLYAVIPVRDTNETAIRLMRRFGSLDGVLSASQEALTSVSGVGERVAKFLFTVGRLDYPTVLGLPDSEPSDGRKVLSDIFSLISREDPRGACLLFEKFGDLRGIAEADIYAISAQLSENMQTAVYIKLLFALASRRVCEKFRFGKKQNPIEIIDYLKALMLDMPCEEVYVVSVDDGGRYIACEHASSGTARASDILPARIISVAERNRAAQIILAHNHPGESAAPSLEDREATALLSALLSERGIKLICHYVIAGDDFTSLKP